MAEKCRTGHSERNITRIEAELVANTEVGPETKILSFQCSGRTPLPKPGQFFMLKILTPGFPLFGRAFSVFDCHAGNGRDRLDFLVRAVGKGTAMLNEAAVGDKAMLVGPAGNGFPDIPEDKKVILVGGGTGIAPLYHLMVELARQGRDPEPVVLLHGARDAASLYIADRLQALPFAVDFSTEDGSLGTRGMVDVLLKARVTEQNGQGHLWIFACGPDPMMRAVAHIGEGQDIPVFLSLETRMACGTGVCNGCAVAVEIPGRERNVREYLRVCHEGTVFLSKSLPDFRLPETGDRAGETV